MEAPLCHCSWKQHGLCGKSTIDLNLSALQLPFPNLWLPGLEGCDAKRVFVFRNSRWLLT